jgi:HAD superfamily hydrolase (TIGR01509 family)
MAVRAARRTLREVITAPQRPSRSSPRRHTAARRPSERTTRPAPTDPWRLSARWRAALDAAESSLRAADDYLSHEEAQGRRTRLAAERSDALDLLRAYARNEGTSTRFVHLTRAWEARRVLALRPGVTACVFELEGVLTGSAELHAAAWRETFDEFISTWVDRTHARIAPFNLRTDYPAHLDGRPRLEGVREFLASRAIRLDEGRPDDRRGAQTVNGLANRKNAALLRRLGEQGVTAFEGARAYLELAREAGLRIALVSASANTATIVDRAGLTPLVDCRVDGDTMAARGLRAAPAPDMLLDACRQLGVEAPRAAAFEASAAGVAAARAAGLWLVVGVERTASRAALEAEGADMVVSGLDEILDSRLAA